MEGAFSAFRDVDIEEAEQVRLHAFYTPLPTL
jgi:hypothetical protein